MVSAEQACAFAILVGGVVSVSFVDAGEQEKHFILHAIAVYQLRTT